MSRRPTCRERQAGRRHLEPTHGPTQQRLALITQLKAALELAEGLNEPTAAYLIERALDEARSTSFSDLAAERYETIN